MLSKKYTQDMTWSEKLVSQNTQDMTWSERVVYEYLINRYQRQNVIFRSNITPDFLIVDDKDNIIMAYEVKLIRNGKITFGKNQIQKLKLMDNVYIIAISGIYDDMIFLELEEFDINCRYFDINCRRFDIKIESPIRYLIYFPNQIS